MSDGDKMKDFRERVKALEPDRDAVKAQHAKGKLTAEERLDLLLDKGSFTELDAFAELQSSNYDLAAKKRPRDGVITGYGTIGKRPAYVYAQDFTFMGGSMGEMHNRKIAKVMELSLKAGCPCIGLFDSGGARIQEGVQALDGGGEIFRLNTMMSGVVPQISVILGPCAGIAVYSPALTDFIFMTKKDSYMFITGPEVIKAVTGEQIDFAGLGGAAAHSSKSGVAHFVAEDEKECLLMVKALLSYLPQNNLENPPLISTADSPVRANKDIAKIVPDDPKKSYDMRDVISEVVDKRTFFEVHAEYAQNAVVGFARLDSRVIGVVANQPSVLAGCLDIDSSNKIAHFVRLCDAFNIPLVNFVDVTGYLPGTEQEHNGIIRHGAKILYAFSEASVPKISLVLRKAYGGAYIALVSKGMGYDKVIAWPQAEIAVMGAEQAVNIIHRKEIAGKDGEKVRKQKVAEYAEKFLNPYVAASQGRVDMVIAPEGTRKSLIACLSMLSTKRDAIVDRQKKYRKHGIIPL
ncbi:acyl-CoA carboxylase subunit beta [Candidatus Woesearchaeota archaeon]|nr:acyl-CoA carboxylase subunit beta [Candidatus Woesearchaeota archaeon]